MVFKEDEIESILKHYAQKYLFSKPYNDYVTFCGISNLENMRNMGKLDSNNTIDDLCLYVILKEKAPKDIRLPDEYEGAKVFYNIGEEFKVV